MVASNIHYETAVKQKWPRSTEVIGASERHTEIATNSRDVNYAFFFSKNALKWGICELHLQRNNGNKELTTSWGIL